MYEKAADRLLKILGKSLGGYFEASHIKKIAKANREAAIIKAETEREVAIIEAETKIDVSEIERRGVARLIYEEGKKQRNIESITAKALGDLREDSKPDELDEDWVTAFFDKSNIISDKKMQTIWAKILSGEANQPGTFSKRTLNIVSNLEKHEAEAFAKLCSFIWFIGGEWPLVVDYTHKIYTDKGVTYSILTDLDSLGLIKLSTGWSYTSDFPESQLIENRINVCYFNKLVCLELKPNVNYVGCGMVQFTKIRI